MPASPFQSAIAKHNPGLGAVEATANLCRTSVTATAIRYAVLTDDAIAVVMSTGTTIDYCCLSDTMKSLREITWLRKGSPLPKGTATTQLSADAQRVAQADRIEAEIDIMDWLGGKRSAPATEEAIGLGSYGKTLTILTCPSVVDETYQDDDDEEDEDELIESWTPRFHR